MISAKDARHRATIFFKMKNSVENDCQLLTIEQMILRSIKNGEKFCEFYGTLYPAVVARLEDLGYKVGIPTKKQQTQQNHVVTGLSSGVSMGLSGSIPLSMWVTDAIYTQISWEEDKEKLG